MTNLSLKRRAEEWIKREEGFRAKPYLDSRGVGTIGHGITWITEEESAMLVSNRVSRCMTALGTILIDNNISLDDFRKTILIDMLYQLGYDGVCRFKKMIAALVDMDYERAADEMLNSQWHIQTPVRCEQLAKRMRTGGIEYGK